jgi:rare lipoprotein A
MAGGVWYVPAAQPGYDEVGLASWYGAGYDGKATADGETYHMNDLSAAHATLPLPSIVEVTNLENGRKIELRINDRGPFHPGRIIDLSRAAADRLGFGGKGTAKVRVRYLRAAPFLDQPSQTVARFEGGRSGTPRTRALPSVTAPDEGSRSPMTAPGGFAVQAGAFSERTNAERAAARLASAGRTTIQSVQRGGGLLYRVTVGSFHSPQEAGATRNRIASLGFNGARVVSGS